MVAQHGAVPQVRAAPREGSYVGPGTVGNALGSPVCIGMAGPVGGEGRKTVYAHSDAALQSAPPLGRPRRQSVRPPICVDRAGAVHTALGAAHIAAGLHGRRTSSGFA